MPPVQAAVSGSSLTSATVAATFGAATLGGTTLYAFICSDASDVLSFSTGSWTRIDNDGQAHNVGQLFVCPNAAAGITTVTVTMVSSGNNGLVLVEWPDDAFTSPGDTQNTGSGASTAPATGSVTPSVANNTVFAFAVTNAAKSGGPTGGFTVLLEIAWFTGGARRLYTAYLDQTTATAASCGWTISSANWDAAIVAVKRGQKPHHQSPLPQLLPQ